MTFDQAQARLKEKGMWFEKEFDSEEALWYWVVYRQQMGEWHERACVVERDTWQAAYEAAVTE